MATKNLGQVAGVHIGNTPPSNTVLIWYDNTPSQMCHKVYDTAKKAWVILDQSIISLVTYSELTNIARKVGLAIGKYFQIKDRSNTLALAITSTKVQYCDSLGNILIDDLGTNIQYHVTSSNLSIDDVVGVFDEINRKLVFQFNEQTPDFDNDYLFGKSEKNGIWNLVKYKLKSLLSSNSGNSISWKNGFFLNVNEILNNLKDKKGGFVSREVFDKTIEIQNKSIQNIGKENQEIIHNATDLINENASDYAVYNKKLPSHLETAGEPVDIKKGDTLLIILSKIQKYITQLKFATGIRISPDYDSTVKGDVNNNDNVETALSKLSNRIKDIDVKSGEDIKICDSDFSELSSKPENINKKDNIYNCAQKLLYWIKHITTDFITDNAVTEQKLADNSVSSKKIIDNAVTISKLSDNLNLFSAVQLIVTSNVTVYSASLVFYETMKNGTNFDFLFDIPYFMPFHDNDYLANVSGVINANMAYNDTPKELTGWGKLYLKCNTALKAKLTLNLRSTGVSIKTTTITPRILFSDGSFKEYSNSIQAVESSNINAKSNYAQFYFDLNTDIYKSDGFKIWINVESDN